MSKRFLLFLGITFLLAACGEKEEKKPAPTPDLNTEAGRGQVVFQTHCATCHAVSGDRQIVGPSLAGIATRAGERVSGQSAEDYLYTSILQPDEYIVEGFSAGSMQQNFGSLLTSDNINEVIAYLLTLN